MYKILDKSVLIGLLTINLSWLRKQQIKKIKQIVT